MLDRGGKVEEVEVSVGCGVVSDVEVFGSLVGLKVFLPGREDVVEYGTVCRVPGGGE